MTKTLPGLPHQEGAAPERLSQGRMTLVDAQVPLHPAHLPFTHSQACQDGASEGAGAERRQRGPLHGPVGDDAVQEKLGEVTQGASRHPDRNAVTQASKSSHR